MKGAEMLSWVCSVMASRPWPQPGQRPNWRPWSVTTDPGCTLYWPANDNTFAGLQPLFD